MKRSSLISLLIILGALCLCLTGCFGAKEENENARPVVTENVTEEWISNATFEEKAERIKKFSSIESLEVFDSEKIKELYDLENQEGLEMSIMGKTEENEVEEIAIIKIIDKDRFDEINTKILDRKFKLREENANNTKILEILDKNENTIIKQQGGIQFMIISKNAKLIEAEIDKIF